MTSPAAITGEPLPPPYEASGVCYAEFGDGLVGKVEVNFLRGDAPRARASRSLAGVRGGEDPVRRHTPCTLVRTLERRPGLPP